jgi:hypothetical protein
MDKAEQQPGQPLRIVENVRTAAGWAGSLDDETICVVDTRVATDQAIRDHVIDVLDEIGCPYPGERLLPTA